MTSGEAHVPMNAKLAYVVLYVDDVDKSLQFYRDVFDLELRTENRSHTWAELETGATTLALTPKKQREADITGGVASADPAGESPRPNIDVSLSVYDVKQCMERVARAGGKVLADPESKNWGQTVAYVSDPDGITIRLGSHVAHV